MRMNKQQARKNLRQGRISPRVVRRRLINEKATAMAANADSSGLNPQVGAVLSTHIGGGGMTANHINQNRNSRTFPAASAVSAANNTRPKRQAPIANYGTLYSGRNSRP